MKELAMMVDLAREVGVFLVGGFKDDLEDGN
jgi:hypothetical protein